MILIKFLGWVMLITLGMILFFRVFGRPIMRFALRYFIKKAQEDLNRQSRIYEQYVDGHSPFEDSVYVQENVRVTVKRGQQEKEKEKAPLDDSIIETVEFEDVD